MIAQSGRAVVLLTFSALAMPALADDCSVARSAMEDTGHKPHSTTTTPLDSQAIKSVTRTVQTVTDKYVQTKDGKWYSMGIAIKDLTDNLKTAKLTCRRSGSDTVNGESAAVYEVHIENEGSISDNKIWVSSKNLLLRSDVSTEGHRYSTVYDFSNVAPPPNATPMGRKPSN
jgi:hypothetical protein